MKPEARRRKVLYIAVEPVVPVNTGSRIRDFYIMKSLAKQFSVELAYMANTEIPKLENVPYLYAESIRLDKAFDSLDRLDRFNNLVRAIVRRGFPMTEFLLGKRQMDQLLQVIHTRNPQIIFLQTSYLLPLARVIRKRYPDIKIVLDAHNIESLLQRRMADTASSRFMKPIKRALTANLSKWEQSAGEVVHGIAAVSEEEALWWRKPNPRTLVEVVPNGVDVNFFQTAKPIPRQPVLCFSGSMSYLPNKEGVLWFYRHVWPQLIQEIPDIRLLVVGKDPDEQSRSLADDRITVTGTVEDVRPYIEQSRLAVVPLLAGGGTRLKILEAMAMQRVIVSTRIGAEGLAKTDGIILADTPQEMAEAIMGALQRDDLPELGRRNRELALEKYSWKAVGERVIDLVDEVTK